MNSARSSGISGLQTRRYSVHVKALNTGKASTLITGKASTLNTGKASTLNTGKASTSLRARGEDSWKIFRTRKRISSYV